MVNKVTSPALSLHCTLVYTPVIGNFNTISEINADPSKV